MSTALPRIAWMRTAIALLQGLVLSELYQAIDNRVWPATDGLVFAPLLAVAIFVPVIFLSGLSNLIPPPYPLESRFLWTKGVSVVGAVFFSCPT
jgi:hypothetical protein